MIKSCINSVDDDVITYDIMMGQAGGVIKLHVGATVAAGDIGLINRDAIAVRRSLAFTVTHVLCNVCTASPSSLEWVDRSNRIQSRFLTVHRIEMKNLASYHH